MSFTKVFESGDFRRSFPVRWQAFLHATYCGPEQVAANFGVRYQTALNWWQGTNAPSGFVVARAFLENGAAAQRMLGG